MRDEFAHLAVEASVSRTVECGHDDEVDIGALTTPDRVQSVRNGVETGVREGADVLTDSRNGTVDGYEGGNFPGTTVFDDVAGDTVIAREEIFVRCSHWPRSPTSTHPSNGPTEATRASPPRRSPGRARTPPFPLHEYRCNLPSGVT